MDKNRPDNTPPKPPETCVMDEFRALQQMLEAMRHLDRAAQTRVMRYLKDRFGVYLGTD